MTTKHLPFGGGRGPMWSTHHQAAGWSPRGMVPDLGLSVGLWHSAELSSSCSQVSLREESPCCWAHTRLLSLPTRPLCSWACRARRDGQGERKADNPQHSHPVCLITELLPTLLKLPFDEHLYGTQNPWPTQRSSHTHLPYHSYFSTAETKHCD